MPLVPEGVLDGEGGGCVQLALAACGEGGKAGFERRGGARGGRRKRPCGVTQRTPPDCEGWRGRCGGTGRRRERVFISTGEDADAFEDAVTSERRGVHGGEVRAVWQPISREQIRDHGIPPAAVVGVKHQGAGDGGELLAAAEAHSVEMPAEVAADDGAEDGEESAGYGGHFSASIELRIRHSVGSTVLRSGVGRRTGGNGEREGDQISSAGASQGYATEARGLLDERRSPAFRSSVSAAIHPDIMTMGMPGPGWAEPPAR